MAAVSSVCDQFQLQPRAAERLQAAVLREQRTRRRRGRVPQTAGWADQEGLLQPAEIQGHWAVGWGSRKWGHHRTSQLTNNMSPPYENRLVLWVEKKKPPSSHYTTYQGSVEHLVSKTKTKKQQVFYHPVSQTWYNCVYIPGSKDVLRFMISPLHSHLPFCLSRTPNTKNTVYCSHQTPNEKTLVAQYVFVFYFIFITVKMLKSSQSLNKLEGRKLPRQDYT